MKKKISLLLTGILTLGLLTGCGGSGAESGTAAADVGTDAAQSTEAADAGTDAAQDVQTEEPSADAVEIVAWHDNDEAMMNALADVVNEKLKETTRPGRVPDGRRGAHRHQHRRRAV